ncbi:MAG: helix-turn-helix transcriptional regulator [Clostridia bacterium]|nr:helix-turn-helix transcriptional regulator [Clostridia bacterium]
MLNEKIREIRLAKKMSQVELAKTLGVTKQSVSNWENDNIQPSIEMLVKIADALCVSTDYLLCREERRFIDVTKLSEDTIQHIQFIVDDIKKSCFD